MGKEEKGEEKGKKTTLLSFPYLQQFVNSHKDPVVQRPISTDPGLKF